MIQNKRPPKKSVAAEASLAAKQEVQRYWHKWSRIYGRWQFWTACLLAYILYAILQPTSVGDFFEDHGTITGLLLVFFIMSFRSLTAHTQNPYTRLTKALHLHKKGPGAYIAVMLSVTVVAQFFPIYLHAETHRVMNGFALLWQHPLFMFSPLLYLLVAYLLLRDYKEWRWSALCFLVGGYFAFIATIWAYTDVDGDIPSIYIPAMMAVMLLPLAAGMVCLLASGSRIKSKKSTPEG